MTAPKSRRLHPGPGIVGRLLVILPLWVALVVLWLSVRGLNEARLRRLEAEVRQAQNAVAETAVLAPAGPEPPPEAPAVEPPPPSPAPLPVPVLPHTVVRAPQPVPPAVEDRRRDRVELALQPAQNGNFYANGTINGRAVRLVVDTGASFVAVPDRLRWQLGLTRGRYLQTQTANGVAGNYETRIQSLSVGPIQLRDVAAVLYPNDHDDTVLLGMSALREVKLSQEGGHMLLQQEAGKAGIARDRTPAPEPALKRPVQDCMGSRKVVDDRVLRCLRGETPPPD
jgi:aspartyl protease family protein